MGNEQSRVSDSNTEAAGDPHVPNQRRTSETGYGSVKRRRLNAIPTKARTVSRDSPVTSDSEADNDDVLSHDSLEDVWEGSSKKGSERGSERGSENGREELPDADSGNGVAEASKQVLRKTSMDTLQRTPKETSTGSSGDGSKSRSEGSLEDSPKDSSEVGSEDNPKDNLNGELEVHLEEDPEVNRDILFKGNGQVDPGANAEVSTKGGPKISLEVSPKVNRPIIPKVESEEDSENDSEDDSEDDPEDDAKDDTDNDSEDNSVSEPESDSESESHDDLQEDAEVNSKEDLKAGTTGNNVAKVARLQGKVKSSTSDADTESTSTRPPSAQRVTTGVLIAQIVKECGVTPSRADCNPPPTTMVAEPTPTKTGTNLVSIRSPLKRRGKTGERPVEVVKQNVSTLAQSSPPTVMNAKLSWSDAFSSSVQKRQRSSPVPNESVPLQAAVENSRAQKRSPNNTLRSAAIPTKVRRQSTTQSGSGVLISDSEFQETASKSQNPPRKHRISDMQLKPIEKAPVKALKKVVETRQMQVKSSNAAVRIKQEVNDFSDFLLGEYDHEKRASSRPRQTSVNLKTVKSQLRVEKKRATPKKSAVLKGLPSMKRTSTNNSDRIRYRKSSEETSRSQGKGYSGIEEGVQEKASKATKDGNSSKNSVQDTAIKSGSLKSMFSTLPIAKARAAPIVKIHGRKAPEQVDFDNMIPPTTVIPDSVQSIPHSGFLRSDSEGRQEHDRAKGKSMAVDETRTRHKLTKGDKMDLDDDLLPKESEEEQAFIRSQSLPTPCRSPIVQITSTQKAAPSRPELPKPIITANTNALKISQTQSEVLLSPVSFLEELPKQSHSSRKFKSFEIPDSDPIQASLSQEVQTGRKLENAPSGRLNSSHNRKPLSAISDNSSLYSRTPARIHDPWATWQAQSKDVQTPSRSYGLNNLFRGSGKSTSPIEIPDDASTTDDEPEILDLSITCPEQLPRRPLHLQPKRGIRTPSVDPGWFRGVVQDSEEELGETVPQVPERALGASLQPWEDAWWPADRYEALIKATVNCLNEIPENRRRKTITGEYLQAITGDNPTLPEWFQEMEKEGIIFQRSFLAQKLLQRVPHGETDVLEEATSQPRTENATMIEKQIVVDIEDDEADFDEMLTLAAESPLDESMPESFLRSSAPSFSAPPAPPPRVSKEAVLDYLAEQMLLQENTGFISRLSMYFISQACVGLGINVDNSVNDGMVARKGRGSTTLGVATLEREKVPRSSVWSSLRMSESPSPASIRSPSPASIQQDHLDGVEGSTNNDSEEEDENEENHEMEEQREVNEERSSSSVWSVPSSPEPQPSGQQTPNVKAIAQQPRFRSIAKTPNINTPSALLKHQQKSALNLRLRGPSLNHVLSNQQGKIPKAPRDMRRLEYLRPCETITFDRVGVTVTVSDSPAERVYMRCAKEEALKGLNLALLMERNRREDQECGMEVSSEL